MHHKVYSQNPRQFWCDRLGRDLDVEACGPQCASWEVAASEGCGSGVDRNVHATSIAGPADYEPAVRTPTVHRSSSAGIDSAGTDGDLSSVVTVPVDKREVQASLKREELEDMTNDNDRDEGGGGADEAQAEAASPAPKEKRVRADWSADAAELGLPGATEGQSAGQWLVAAYGSADSQVACDDIQEALKSHLPSYNGKREKLSVTAAGLRSRIGNATKPPAKKAPAKKAPPKKAEPKKAESKKVPVKKTVAKKVSPKPPKPTKWMTDEELAAFWASDAATNDALVACTKLENWPEIPKGATFASYLALAKGLGIEVGHAFGITMVLQPRISREQFEAFYDALEAVTPVPEPDPILGFDESALDGVACDVLSVAIAEAKLTTEEVLRLIAKVPGASFAIMLQAVKDGLR